MQSITLKTKFALAITLILWASAFVGIRIALTGYTPGALALFRFLIASASMGVAFLYLPRDRPPIAVKDVLLISLLSALTLSTYHIALNYGELTVSSGIASFIISQSPIVTAVFAIIFLGESINLMGMFGLLISVAGVTIIFMSQAGGFKLDSGVLLVFISTIAGSLFSIFQKPFLKKYHYIEVTAYFLWGGTAVLLIYIPDLLHEVGKASLQSTLAIIYLGIFPAALAYGTWNFVLSKMPASRAANFLYFLPLLTTLLGWLLLGEIPLWTSIAGGLIALFGTYILNKS